MKVKSSFFLVHSHIIGFELLKQYGMTHTSVEKVTKVVGLGCSTFYNFFQTEEKFIYEIRDYLLSAGKREYVNGMEVIKAFNQTASSMKRYENVVVQYRDALVRWFRHVWPYLSVYGVVTPSTIAKLVAHAIIKVNHKLVNRN